MIEVSRLSKSYRDRKALDGVSFSVKRGEILGLLGPNGAGKSTTMKIISGILAADSGEAVVNGFSVSERQRDAKASIGYLPETPPVVLGMEVGAFLEFAAGIHGVAKDRVKSAVETSLEACDLKEVRNRIIGNLSKGFRQRVGLAQAIVHRPPVLILDEPTVGLDPRQILEVRKLIRSLAGNHTVILSTHILSEVKATCDRVVVIDQGRVLADETLDALSARVASDKRVIALVEGDPSGVVPNLSTISGVSRVSTDRRNNEHRIEFICSAGADPRTAIATALVEARLGLKELILERATLEEAFVKLVTDEEQKI